MNYIDNIPTPSAIYNKFKDTERRAEAAEARAADAEVRAKSWHDSAMTLADQRDAAYKRNTELEAERDELARKLERAQRDLAKYREAMTA